MPQLTSLVKRLNALGAEVLLPPHWALVPHEYPNIGERLHPTFIHHPDMKGPFVSRAAELEDVFDSSLIDGMPEARYLGRKICELRVWLAERTDVLTGERAGAGLSA